MSGSAKYCPGKVAGIPFELSRARDGGAVKIRLIWDAFPDPICFPFTNGTVCKQVGSVTILVVSSTAEVRLLVFEGLYLWNYFVVGKSGVRPNADNALKVPTPSEFSGMLSATSSAEFVTIASTLWHLANNHI